MASSRKDVATHYVEYRYLHKMVRDRYNNLIKFRDILLNNEDIKRQYEKLKTELADKYKDNRKEYTKSKDDFISKVLGGNL